MKSLTKRMKTKTSESSTALFARIHNANFAKLFLLVRVRTFATEPVNVNAGEKCHGLIRLV